MLPQREDGKLRRMFLKYNKKKLDSWRIDEPYDTREKLYKDFINEVSRTFTWTLKESEMFVEDLVNKNMN